MNPAQSSSVDVERNRTGSLLMRSGWFLLEIGLLVLLFLCFSPGGVPGVNEPHYLCKAKHFWDNGFCSGDVFLDSADAHYLFYFTLGALTKFFSLSTSAWIGRLICWIAIAIGWQFLVKSITGERFWSVLAAGVFLLGLHYCHFAGEWLIGGVEAKGLAYAFVFAGAGYLVQGKWTPVWCLFGLGAAFHVLVGGWAVIAAFFPWILGRGWNHNLKGQLIAGVAGFLISMIGLVPALVLTLGQDPKIVAQANEIYTFERIAHHLVYSHIVSTNPARLDFFLSATMAWVGLSWVGWEVKRLRMFFALVAATLLIAMAAVCLENYLLKVDRPDLAASLLRYYWFRLSDVFVPAGIGIGLVVVLQKCLSVHYNLGAIGITAAVLLVTAHITTSQVSQAIQQRSQADALTLPSFEGEEELNIKTVKDWIDVCSWIRARTSPESRFITPRAQSTFKWYAQRSEVVSWKDVPQDAVGIVNWRNRFSHVFGAETFRFGLASLDAEKRLVELGKKYDAQYLVIERRHVRERKKELEFRYRYQQYLFGKPTANTPFKKPLCLKLVYPDSSCSPEIINESSYLVYQLVIPQAYQPQLDAMQAMFDWYAWFEDAADSQQPNSAESPNAGQTR